MIINMIVAMDKENGIGKNNKLLCHIKEDMQYFKKTTMNSIVIMGRKTYESLPSGALPNRLNIVLSRKDLKLKDAISAKSVEKALSTANYYSEILSQEVFIIGGSNIYEQFLPFADRLYITHIEDVFDADSYFPILIPEEWEIKESTSYLQEKIPYYRNIYKHYDIILKKDIYNGDFIINNDLFGKMVKEKGILK